jgi:hypothetical protein
VTLDAFEQNIFEVASRSPLCDEPSIVVAGEETIRIRIDLFTGGWIDVFYNQRTQTTAYVLIRNEKRIFGADNTGGWHIHPFDDPSRHDPLATPLSFADFISEIERHETLR